MGAGIERAAAALRSVHNKYHKPYDDDLQRADEIGQSLQADVLPHIAGRTVEEMAYFERLGFRHAKAKNGRKFGFYTFEDDPPPWITVTPMKAGEATLRHRHTGPSTVHVVAGELTVKRFERQVDGSLDLVSKKTFLPGTICSIGKDEIHQFLCDESSCLYMSGFPSSCRTLAFLEDDRTQEYAGGGVHDTFIYRTQDDVEVGPNGPVPREQVADDKVQTDRVGAAGGGGNPTSMESRLTRLEVEFEHVRKDLDEIKADQKIMLGIMTDVRVEIGKLPTSEKLFVYTATVGAIAFAIVAVFIGVLAYVGALPK